jgi:hypothetical protein
MAAQHKGVPEGASRVIPRLFCRDVEAQIEFCCEALGAVEDVRRPGPDGRAHAMLKFGPAMLMLEAEVASLWCRWRPTSGVTELDGSKTPPGTCGPSRHASRKQRKTSAASDGRKFCWRKLTGLQ